MDGNLSWYCYFVNSSGAIRVCPDVISWFESRSKSKNRDKLFNYTVRVSVVVPVLELQMFSKGTKLFEICCYLGTGIVDFNLAEIHKLSCI